MAGVMSHAISPQGRTERLAGLTLMAAAIAALILANSPFGNVYRAVVDARLGPLTLHGWVADGLMAIFFLLIGLEVKREWLVGRLSTPAERRLPIIAAAFGMAAPALVFLTITGGDPQLIRGWAIPAATDIAFALGALALLGRRASPSIKLLLVTIAIIDDIGAVAIIAVAYTSNFNTTALALSAVIVAAMAIMNYFRVRRLWPYIGGFVLLWLAVHDSGIHATIAGVAAAMTVPLDRAETRSPLKRLEHLLHPYVMFGIVPFFGLTSAGVEIEHFGAMLEPLPLGVALGLLLGKQVGIFGSVWAATRMGICPPVKDATWPQIYGAALLCGIGFTMSLFIGELAFPAQTELAASAKIGILAGSLASGLFGFVVLRLASPTEPSAESRSDAEQVFAADEDQS